VKLLSCFDFFNGQPSLESRYAGMAVKT
jgi:hypothetical protein